MLFFQPPTFQSPTRWIIKILWTTRSTTGTWPTPDLPMEQTPTLSITTKIKMQPITIPQKPETTLQSRQTAKQIQAWKRSPPGWCRTMWSSTRKLRSRRYHFWKLSSRPNYEACLANYFKVRNAVTNNKNIDKKEKVKRGNQFQINWHYNSFYIICKRRVA